MTVSVPGFKTAVLPDVKLDVGIPATVNVTLEVGQIPHPDDIDRVLTFLNPGFTAANGAGLLSIGPATNLPGPHRGIYPDHRQLLLHDRRHHLKMGADVRWLDNAAPLLPNVNDAFTFSSGDRLAANNPNSLTVALGPANLSYAETDQFYYFRLNPEKALAWVTITIPNNALSYEKTSQVWRADLQVYGIIQDLGGRIVTEFEESLALQIPPDKQEQEMRAQSVFQKSFLLEPGTYMGTTAAALFQLTMQPQSTYWRKTDTFLGELRFNVFPSMLGTRFQGRRKCLWTEAPEGH